MTAKPAVRDSLVPQTAEQELLCLHFPEVHSAKQADTACYPAKLPAKQADTGRCPAVYSAELPAGQADTVRCPAVYSAEQAADIAEGNPAEYSVRTAEDSPAEHSVRTAEGSPAEYSADRKADKGCTEVLPQVRLRLL